MIEPKRGIPKCPKHFRAPARAAWEVVTSFLAAKARLYPCDFAIIESFAFECWMLIDVARSVRRDGFFLSAKDKKGMAFIYEHPGVSLIRAGRTLLGQLGHSLMFSPQTRRRILAKLVNDRDELELILDTDLRKRSLRAAMPKTPDGGQ